MVSLGVNVQNFSLSTFTVLQSSCGLLITCQVLFYSVLAPPTKQLDNHCEEQEYSYFAEGERFSTVFTRHHMQGSIHDAWHGLEHLLHHYGTRSRVSVSRGAWYSFNVGCRSLDTSLSYLRGGCLIYRLGSSKWKFKSRMYTWKSTHQCTGAKVCGLTVIYSSFSLWVNIDK